MEAFLIYLFKASGILSIFYLAYYFLLRKDTFFTINRHFLLIGIISSILLPFLEFTHIEFVEIQNPNVLGEYTTIPSTSNTTEITNWWFIGCTIYCSGVILLSLRFGFQLLSLKKLLLNNSKEKDGDFNLIKVSEDIAPFSFFRSIVYNPSSHSNLELEMILKHEKTHVTQHHTIDILIVNLFHIFQWINPIMWMYKKSLEQNLEFIADRETVDIVQSKKEYQLTLVKVSSNNYSTITNNFYQSLIKKRIVMLNKQTSERKHLWKILLILPFISLFLWSFNTKEITKFQPQESTISDKYVFSPSETETKNNTIEFIINKNSSKEDFEKIKKIFKNEYQVDIKFSKIERNNSKEITGINIDISSKSSNANYAIQNDDPITAFVISYNSKKGKIKIHQRSNDFYVFGNEKHKSGKRSKVFKVKPGNEEHSELIFIEGGNNAKIIRKKDKNGKVIIEEILGDSDNIFEIHTDENNAYAYIMNDSDKEPLIIINGKEVSKKEMKALNTKDIESMNVLKGENAIKKYSEKGENGVIEITTKKK